MSIKADGWRRVQHKVTVQLDGEDTFEAVNSRGYGAYKDKTITVSLVSWPVTYGDPRGPATADSSVDVQGFMHRKDGTVGMRTGHSRMKVDDLPRPVAEALVAMTEKVYQP